MGGVYVFCMFRVHCGENSFELHMLFGGEPYNLLPQNTQMNIEHELSVEF